MLRTQIIAAFISVSCISFNVLGASAQDADKGAQVFHKCQACHVADQDTNRVGPSLKGVIGRTAGTYAGYSYSSAMKEAGAGGLVWNDDTLSKYLRKPKDMVPKTKMAFAGLKSDDEIANVIAYLKTFSTH
ncbi:cytochrome c family protein [Ochrobactrum pecoris]|uniref:Cytochrome c n=1 Tax=Brucella pecoris TaxID=867683 RepID=A0A5C5CDB7_9HYPH|nr:MULTISPECIES: cytochrome c family protein [Brucella]MBB4095940.1 cytochrome c [Brucella pecoris]NKW82701.1 cytochrome c family protein [Brucella pecoris]NVM43180.1 cytochrome c family protein [Brucella intermedia]TNV09044.1 cytochrome c family protein [Brucella pecoris]